MSFKNPYRIDPRLEAGTIAVGELSLCSVLLKNDARFPWLILVPRRADVFELIDLNEKDRLFLMNDIAQASTALQSVCQPDKINIGSLGNIVPQLHVHVVARFKTDAAWPGPVWGHGSAKNYDETELRRMTTQLAQSLSLA